MLAGFARQYRLTSLSKAGGCAGLAFTLLLAGAGSVHNAAALNDALSGARGDIPKLVLKLPSLIRGG